MCGKGHISTNPTEDRRTTRMPKGTPSSPRLQDVAEAAGVSIATASRSLSGASGVSEGVAERVREQARAMGYVVNLHARSLAGGSTRSVGLVVHEIGDPYFSEIASGVLGVGAREGLTVQICHTGRDPARELEQLRMLVANRVGAIIVAGSGLVDAVLPDNVLGARAVAEHVLSLGHRRIAVASGSRQLTTVADRLAGIEQACTAAGLDFADLPVVEADFTRAGGKEAAERILTDHPGITALLALNDDMAIGVLSTLRARGVSVPGQVSVTGFDDVAVAGDLAPSLTTVRLPMSEMGEQALLLALKDPGTRPRRRTVGAELVVRGSTGSAPA